jgi:4-hydroxyphenylpyruvate dioxygenase
VRIVLTTPLTQDSPIHEHLRKHGDGVKVAALWVDATSAYQETMKRGARSFMEPTVEKDEFGEVVRSGIYTYGETVHVFVERKIIRVFSCQVIRNGNQITIQSQQG